MLRVERGVAGGAGVGVARQNEGVGRLVVDEGVVDVDWRGIEWAGETVDHCGLAGVEDLADNVERIGWAEDGRGVAGVQQ